MQDELYADSIAEITVTGTIIRIDFASLSPTEKDLAGQPHPVLRQRVIMSVEGFANSFEVMEKAMQGLIDAGAIRRNGVPSDLAMSLQDGKANSRGKGSPNFA
jgi:hypothetical protein